MFHRFKMPQQKPPLAWRKSLQPEFLHERLVGLLVHLREVCEELLALGHHLQQAAARMKVLLILLQMGGESLDLLREKSDLILGRTRVRIMSFHITRYLFLLLVRERHSVFVSDGLAAAVTRRTNPRSMYKNYLVRITYFQHSSKYHPCLFVAWGGVLPPQAMFPLTHIRLTDPIGLVDTRFLLIRNLE